MLTRWAKRIVFALLGLAGILFVILGSQQPQIAPPGYTVVEYWEKWTGNEALQMQQIVTDFNQSAGKQKKIFVRYMSMASIEQKTLIATSAGVPPDVAGLEDRELLQFASLGALRPLDDLATKYGIKADSFMPVFWNACHYHGRLYGMVSTPVTVAMIYNKQIFQQCATALRAAGCDPNRAPQTIAELDKYAAVLDRRDASGGLDRAGYIPTQSWFHPEIAYWFGGNIFDPITQKFTIDSPQSIRAYQWMQSYSKKLGYREIHAFDSNHTNFDSPNNPFMTGKLVMQQQGPYIANFIDHLNPSMSTVLVPKDQEYTLPNRRDNYAWGAAPFPTAVPGLENVSYNSFDFLGVPSGARHPEEAFEFIAYVNRPDVAEKLCMLHCKNCQIAHVSAAFIKDHPNPYIEVFQNLAAGPNARALPPVAIWPEVMKDLVDTAQAIAYDGTDPAVALAQTQQRAETAYARFLRIEREREQLGIN